MAERADILQKTDCFFSFSRELKPDNGEDSYVFALNEKAAMVGVFDGCGGSGSTRYENLSDKTGAYLASRAVCAAYLDWFDQDGERASAVKKRIQKALSRCEIQNGGQEGALSGVLKRLPTTAAVAICRTDGQGMELRLHWAGDSRIYLLDEEGLAQLTEDDLGGLDALEELSQDRALTNAITLSRNYTLHTAERKLKKPGILFGATDGCFGGLATPMEFEYLLLHTLEASDCAADWENRLSEAVGEHAGDDCTISGLVFGYGSFEALKCSLSGRTGRVFREYINGLDACSESEILQLWKRYEPGYYRMLCRGNEPEQPAGGRENP